MQENPGAQVLTTVLRDPGRPRITWYGADGERVELSGAVLANWVYKSANLLIEEFDAGPGFRVRLDLPMHWRTICWALAVWQIGACVVVGSGDADAIVGTAPRPGVVPYVVVALPALARSVPLPLPRGAFDAAASLGGYPDVLGPIGRIGPELPAMAADGRQWTFGDLERATPDDRRPVRALLPSAAMPVHAALLRVRQVLQDAGSVVLVQPGDQGPGISDVARATLDHLRVVERVDIVDESGAYPETG